MTAYGHLCCSECGEWYDDSEIPDHCITCGAYLREEDAMFEPEPTQHEEDEG